MKSKDKKEENEDTKMGYQIIGGIVLIIALIFLLVPTIDVLTISITMPPEQSNVVLIENKITVFQSFQSLPQNVKQGNIEVNITLQDSSNKVKFNETYFLRSGSWIINTYQPISKNDIVIIEVSFFKFKKVIPID